MQTRRDFLTRSSAAFMVSAAAAASPKDQISLAAWSLVRSFFDTHRWKNPDLPKICSEQLGIHGLEFVNQFFENPTMNSLKQLRRNASDYGVTLVRIMVDDEGNMAAVDRKERMESAIAHRKWVDIAHLLGCTDIRCNMRGGLPEWKRDQDLVSRAAESFNHLLAYARDGNIDIIIENHGGASSDPEVLVGLMKAVNNPHFGTLPDFGNVNPGDSHEEVIRKIVPYAKGVSVKAAWAEDGTHPGWDLARMIKICQDAGFHGWWGIESSYGRLRGRPGQPAPAAPQLTPDELWERELKGVRLAKAVLEPLLAKSA